MSIVRNKGGNADTDVEDRTRPELVHLIRKLRWMGMEEEAARKEALLAGTPCEEPVLVGETATD
jgi:hypothetical protein